jgi:hypothetical protein
MYLMSRKERMTSRKVTTNISDDIYTVIVREKGIASTTAYLNYALRDYLTEKGLLPEVPA